ncbi:MAG: beta-lactamase family protein [Alphaproteobacteria bacterium]|nr:beta-lactamase family protein [Alphaproteobacteria bacterium]
MTRRSVVLGSLSAALIAPGRGSALLSRWRQAADYSADHRGVSMLVMQRGQILFENYPRDGNPTVAYELASGTKSFNGITAAAAAFDGFLSIDEPCAATLSEWRGETLKSAITIRQLLTLTSGIKVRIGGRPPGYREALDAEVVHRPGTQFSYGAAPFQIFGEIMQRKLSARRFQGTSVDYLKQRVLGRIGALPGGWRLGRDGNPMLPQGAQFTARHWATFGQFVLDASGGGANGLDHAVLDALFQGTSANPGYGLTWWLLRPGLIGPSERAGMPKGLTGDLKAEDIVMAAGAGDQRLYLLRKRQLIVVRQADRIGLSLFGLGSGYSDGAFLKLVLADA